MGTPGDMSNFLVENPKFPNDGDYGEARNYGDQPSLRYDGQCNYGDQLALRYDGQCNYGDQLGQ